MKKLFLFIQLLLAGSLLHAQLWTGNVSSDWNTPGNWNPAGVPVISGNVVIPGSVVSNNWPVFSTNVTINSIEMQPGSRLNTGGYELTINSVNANNNFNGAILSNSNAATDIVINWNTGTNGFQSYFTGNTVNDDINFNLSGSNQFIESVAPAASQYNGNVSFNINGPMPVLLFYQATSQVNGNLTVTRTVTGNTSLFYSGATIAGDFTYNNNIGGSTGMGNTAYKTSIGGAIFISVDNPLSPASFEMYRIVNQTGGGIIQIQHSQGFNVQYDTLSVASLSITGYKGSEYARLLNNDITGSLTTADDPSYAGGFITYIRNNVITGNSSFSNNGTNVFFEGDVAGTGNQYIGNVTFNAAGGAMYIAHGAPLQCSGNMAIIRSAAGHTQAFNSGADIGGNFAFTLNSSGNTYLGNIAYKTNIEGTVNIACDYSTAGAFEMYRLVNQANGGSIYIQNPYGFNISNDTLVLSSLTIAGYQGNQYASLIRNTISGNVSIASDPTYGGGFATYIRSNVITGNSVFTNNGINNFFEGDDVNSGNQYIGDVTFNATGGPVYIAQASPLQCTGNLTINRTAEGHTQAFNHGSVIGGNFSYTNNTAGNTYLGNVDYRTSIAGTINILCNYTTPGIFAMYRIINEANGGNIFIQNSYGFDVLYDTLIVGSLGITGYRGNQYGRLLNNQVTGDVTTADDVSFGAGFYTYIRNNVITGNTSFSNNGTNTFLEGDEAGTGNRYNGNVTFTANGGPIYIAHGAPLQCSGNLDIIRTVTGHTQAFNRGSVIGGNFSFTGNVTCNTYLGNPDYRTAITGTVNIVCNNTVPGAFEMYRLINQANGGSIEVQNSFGFSIMNDTLKVAYVSVTGYRGNQYGNLMNNSIAGDVTLADDITSTGGYYTYVRSNHIAGNTSFTNNGGNVFIDADVAASGNRYDGDVTFTRNGANMNIAWADADEISGNLTLNSNDGIIIGKIKLNGNTNTVIEQSGIQPVSMMELAIEKTAHAMVTLNDSLTVVASVAFTSGILNSSVGKELIFMDNSVYTGGSDASFVNGPVKKTGDDPFVFPVGNAGRIAPIGISAPLLNTDVFRATYFQAIPHNSGYDSTQKDPAIHHVSDNEYWLLDRVAGTSAVSVTLSWDEGRSGVVNNIPDLLVARWDGARWKDEGNGITTGTNVSGTVRSANAVSSFSPFTLASSSSFNPLPVHLVRFEVMKVNGMARLQWMAENELSFSRYEIERSNDGAGFTRIASVTAKGAAGSNSYEVYDDQPMNGINYYRLKMIDRSAAFCYSIIVKAIFDANSQSSIYPNPASGYFMISNAGWVQQAALFNMNGILVRKYDQTMAGRYDLTGLAKGLYLVRLYGKGETITLKLVVE